MQRLKNLQNSLWWLSQTSHLCLKGMHYCFRINLDQLGHELVRVLGFDIILTQIRIRKIFQIRRNNNSSLTTQGGSKHMVITGIR